MHKEGGDAGLRAGAAPVSEPGRIRVLFVAEAVTLAHVARVHALAQLLDPAAFEICVAADPRYNNLLGAHAFLVRDIHSIPSSDFVAALQSGRPLYDIATLERYLDQDRRLIEAFDPDVVIGDFRLSLGVAARLSRKPYINVTNAGWSPYATVRFKVPDLALVRWVGVPLAQMIFDAARPVAFRAHASPFNALRKRYGLAPLADLRAVYTDGDYVLYADVPELFSMRPMPSTQRFLGAILWAPDGAPPSWWNSLPPERPVIYVTLGSSGDSRLLGTIIDSLSSLPVSVIVATAGRAKIDRVAANAYVADYLPGILAAQRSALVLCNGGSPTCYQALSAGVPVLGIPSNLDQFINMSAVETFGAGALLRSDEVSARTLIAGVEQLLQTKSVVDCAVRLRSAIERCRPGAVLVDVVRQALGSTAERHARVPC